MDFNTLQLSLINLFPFIITISLTFALGILLANLQKNKTPFSFKKKLIFFLKNFVIIFLGLIIIIAVLLSIIP